MALELKDVIVIFLSSVALVVSMTSFVLNYRHSRRATILGRKPVLVFEYDANIGWTARNVGNGPALNVLIAQKRVGGDWFNPVRIPPLSRDGSILLAWLGHINTCGLGATYTDSEGTAYTSVCGNDRTSTNEGVHFGPWREDQIGKHWNQPAVAE